MLKRAFANLAGTRGISYPTPKMGATLPFPEAMGRGGGRGNLSSSVHEDGP